MAISVFLLCGGSKKARVLCVFISALSLFINFAMYEFILAHNSVYAIGHVQYLLDDTFVSGTVMNMEHPVFVAAFFVLTVAGAVLAKPIGYRRAPLWWLLVAMIGMVVVCIWPLNERFDEWRQRNALATNLATLSSSMISEQGGVEDEQVVEAYSGNLDGQRWLEPLLKGTNVLLVLLEGVSGAYLPSVAAEQGVKSKIQMPELDSIGNANVFLSSVPIASAADQPGRVCDLMR